jgi:DNA anti-recombination protein RmuC
MICMDCFALQHSGHKCESLEAAGRRKKGDHEKVLHQASAMVGTVNEACARLAESADACAQQRTRAEGGIRASFAHLKETLDERERAMLDQLRAVGQAAAMEAAESKKEMASWVGEVEKATSALQTTVDGEVTAMLTHGDILEGLSYIHLIRSPFFFASAYCPLVFVFLLLLFLLLLLIHF